MITEALLVVIVSGVAALGGSAINGAVARAKTRSELEASPYTALATRVVALEAQVQDLTRCREEDRGGGGRETGTGAGHGQVLQSLGGPFWQHAGPCFNP